MLSRDDLYFKILVLIPEAKFSFWLHDDRVLDENDEIMEYIRMDDWCIGWMRENSNPCPSISEIQSVTTEQINTYKETVRKQIRDTEKANDPIYLYFYQNYKLSNPQTTFSQFLDYVETIQLD